VCVLRYGKVTISRAEIEARQGYPEAAVLVLVPVTVASLEMHRCWHERFHGCIVSLDLNAAYCGQVTVMIGCAAATTFIENAFLHSNVCSHPAG